MNVTLKSTVARKALRTVYSDNDNNLNKYDNSDFQFNSFTRLPFYLNGDDSNFFPKKRGNYKKKKPFTDLTRDSNVDLDYANNKFAIDYLDISDLQRKENRPHNIEIVKHMTPQLTNEEKFKILKLLQLRSRRMVPLQKNNKRFFSFVDSFSDSESSEPESSTEVETEKSEDKETKNNATTKTSKRYRIINNSEESSEDSSSDSDRIVYIQAPGRFIDADDDLRRRLPQFLPKRMHWNEDDHHNLRNYWIKGPRGKYPR
ncbi:uncharacterized protein [Epargyreus clarus]|uniref:uncharacterized protein n=1 Tax=Epargyreus clarus TaxID=520877 RepID=UPI003C2C162B